MVLLAMVRGDTFNQISRPPRLTPVIQSGAIGTYRGGGYSTRPIQTSTRPGHED